MCCCVWVAPSLGVGRAEVLADRIPKLLGMMAEVRGEGGCSVLCNFLFNMCKAVLDIGEGSQPRKDLKGCELLRKSIERIRLIHRSGVRVREMEKRRPRFY